MQGTKKLRILALAALVVAITVSGYSLYAFYKSNVKGVVPAIAPINQATTIKEAKDETNLGLSVPNGYKISFFAENLGGPRDLEFDPNGTLLASIPSQGKIVALPEGTEKTVADGLFKPHGIAFKNGKLYVAEENAVDVFDYDTKNFKATNKRKIIDLPPGGEHTTRSIMFTQNGKLLISVGSTCNACVEANNQRATILQANDDGSDLQLFATGLRNSVFMTTNPKTKEIWATDMGRDYLGDDTPYDEVNIIREGGMYGWPYCYNDRVVDGQMNKNGAIFDCSTSIPPYITFQAHSAPLGLAFYKSDLLISFHGSWNRTVPTGYKIVRVTLDPNGNPTGQEDFITGWLKGGIAKGRPVDIAIDKSGKIYVSDDKLGVVYLIEVQN